MRKIVLGLGISLDGYIARPNGAVDFLFMPKDYSFNDFMQRIDTAILGRKTHDDGLKMGGTFSGSKIKYYVMSHTLPAGTRDNVTFTNATPKRLVADIRKSRGKDIWLMGGGQIARSFLKDDLVDELYIGVVPTLIGEGIPLFPAGFPQREFSLVSNETFSKGLIALTYARKRSRKKASR